MINKLWTIYCDFITFLLKVIILFISNVFPVILAAIGYMLTGGQIKNIIPQTNRND